MLDTRPPARDDLDDEPVRPRRRLDGLVLALPAVLMLVLGLWGLGRDDAMGNDEVATRWLAGLPLRDLAHVLRHVDAVHGLYYLTIHAWLVFGRTPTAIRVPSVLAMVGAVVVVAALTRRLTGSLWAGAAAGSVAAVTTGVSYYAQTARSYALVYLVVGLATATLVRALDAAPAAGRATHAAWRTWAAYGALLVLGGYLNELSLLVLGAHLVTVLLARRGRPVVAWWLGTCAVAVLLVLPLVWISRGQSEVLDYLTAPGGHAVWLLAKTYFGGTAVVAVVVAALAVVGAGAHFPAGGSVSPATVGLPLLIVPAGLLIGYSEVATPLYADRYVLFGGVGAAVLAGAGLDALVRWVAGRRLAAARPLLVALACVLLLVGQLPAQRVARTPKSRQFDFGGPARFVAQRAQPGDGVLFFGSFFRKARLGYPGEFRDTVDLAQRVSPERAATFGGIDKPFATVRPLMLRHDRIWVVGRPPADVSGLGPADRAEARELIEHYVRVTGHRFGRITATLWRRV